MLSVQQEKYKQAEKGLGNRQIGENKPKLSDEEKEELQKRQRFEQYLKRISQQDGAAATAMNSMTGQAFSRGFFNKMVFNSSKAGFLDMLEHRYKA